MLVILTDNGQLIRPAGSDPAGTLTRLARMSVGGPARGQARSL